MCDAEKQDGQFFGNEKVRVFGTMFLKTKNATMFPENSSPNIHPFVQAFLHEICSVKPPEKDVKSVWNFTQ